MRMIQDKVKNYGDHIWQLWQEEAVLVKRYRIDRVYFLVNMNAKPFMIQFFIATRDSSDRSYLLQIGRRSQFKKDLIPASTRLNLLSK